jgi:hypothetical protein
MKSPFPKYILTLLACAACAAGGYWYGQQNGAAVAAGAATKGHAGSGSNQAGGVRVENATNLDDLLHANGKLDGDLLARWASSLSPAELAAALQTLKSAPATGKRSDIISALYNVWAQRDPKGFLGSLDTMNVPRLRESGVDAALKTWAAQDPQAAMQWIKDNPGTASTAAYTQRYAAAIAGYAATDPQGALAIVNGLGDGSLHDTQLKSAAAKALSDTLADQGQFSQAVTLFSQMPAGQAQTAALGELASRWADSSPQDASNWIAGLSDPQQRIAMGTQVASTWAANDPLAAATWAAQIDQQTQPAAPDPNNPNPGQPNLGGQLLASAIQSWANYDLDAPGQFLNSLPASPTKDTSVAIFSLHASQEDPSSAMQWVSTITNDQVRQGVTMGVAIQWLQQDPNGFNQFVANTTILTDQQKQMLSNIPPQALQGMTRFNSMMGGNAIQQMMENALINGSGGAGPGPVIMTGQNRGQQFAPSN